MKVNSNINVLGGLPDWNLVNVFLERKMSSVRADGGLYSYTAIKTDKSVTRFENAISETLIRFANSEVEILVRTFLEEERLSNDALLLLFWNASFNNELLNYLNDQVYFVSFYSGKITIKQDEVLDCLKDLREREVDLKKWSESTIDRTASKYLTLLKKFNLMQGSVNKEIVHPYLNDKMFVIFVYWLKAIESRANLLDSDWIKFSFCEPSIFLERLMHKKFSKYYELLYTGDKLKIQTLFPYSTIYNAIK